VLFPLSPTAEGRARLLAACPEPVDGRAFDHVAGSRRTHAGDRRRYGETRLRPRRQHRHDFGKTAHESRLLSGPPRAALCNYTAAISSGLAKSNVAINNILPGMFDTAAMQQRFETQSKENGTTYKQEQDKWIAQVGIPALKLGDAKDVGALCALLCSQYASFIIGQSIVIDGGQLFSTF